MILEQAKGRSTKVDDTLLLSVLAGVTLAMLLWICTLVYDIQTALKEIHNTLDIMQDSLEQYSVQLNNINEHLKVICYMGQQQIECP